MDVEKLVRQYIQLRDKIAELTKKHKDEKKPFVDMMDKMDGILMNYLSANNIQSVKTEAGTIFITNRLSATIEDSAAFREYVITNGQFDLVDWRANAPAVSDFLEDRKTLPDGVKFSTYQQLSVRRS